MNKHKKTDSLKIGKFVPLSSSTTNSDFSCGQQQKNIDQPSKKLLNNKKTPLFFQSTANGQQKRSHMQSGIIYTISNKHLKAKGQPSQYPQDKFNIKIVQSSSNVGSCFQQQEIPNLNFEQMQESMLVKKSQNSNLKMMLANQKTERINYKPKKVIYQADKNSCTTSQWQGSLSSSYFRSKLQKGDRASILENQLAQANEQLQRLFEIIDNQSNAIGVLRQKVDKLEKRQLKMVHEFEIQTLKNKKLSYLLDQAQKYRKNKQQGTKNPQSQKKNLLMLNSKFQNWQLLVYFIICLVISKLF